MNVVFSWRELDAFIADANNYMPPGYPETLGIWDMDEARRVAPQMWMAERIEIRQKAYQKRKKMRTGTMAESIFNTSDIPVIDINDAVAVEPEQKIYHMQSKWNPDVIRTIVTYGDPKDFEWGPWVAPPVKR